MPNITILIGEFLCPNPLPNRRPIGSYREPTADNEDSVSYKALSFTLYSQQIGYFFFQQSLPISDHNSPSTQFLGIALSNTKSLPPLSHPSPSCLHYDKRNTSFHHDTSFTTFMSKYTYHSYAACKDPFTCARTHSQVTQYPSTRKHATTTASPNPIEFP